jgi:hypothetical protein
MLGFSRKYKQRERRSTVDLLIKAACVAKDVNNISNLKKS